MSREQARDEVKPVDPIKALWNWRRRGFSDAEIAEILRREELRAFPRHMVTAKGCAAILEALGER